MRTLHTIQGRTRTASTLNRPPVLILLFLLTALVVTPAFSLDPVVNELRNALVTIAKNQHRPVVRVALGNFTYQDTSVGSSFSRYIEDQITSAISEAGGVLQIQALASVNRINPALRDLFSSAFRLENVEAVIQGSFAETAEGGVRLTIDMLDFSTGSLVGRREVVVDKSFLPPGTQLLSANAMEAVERERSLRQLLERSEGSLKVAVITSRGLGAVYREGEEMTLYVSVNKDAFIKIYHIDATGTRQLIFPNQYHRENRIRQGGLVKVPEENYPFRFKLTPPFGTEFIKVIASTSQFADIEQAFQSQGSFSSAWRGLAVISAEQSSAEALTNYTIIER